jgi:hypothetical protein
MMSLPDKDSTLPNAMLQYDAKNKYGNEIRFYVAYFKDSNKKDIRFKELLSHYARLQPWIPFYIR